MINTFKQWLNKPYSYREEVNFQIVVSFIIGAIVFAVLYLLEPFGLAALENNLFYYFLGYGVITTVMILLFFFLFAPIFPTCFSNKTWTIKKEIITLSSLTFIIGCCSWLYHKKIAIGNDEIINKFNFLYFLKSTLAIGVFPIVIYVYLAEKLLANSRKKIAENVKKKNINLSKKLFKNKEEKIRIFAKNQKNSIEFTIKNLIFVTSEGNYATFYIKDNNSNTIAEKVLRVQLRIIEKTLQEYAQIVRCHKSYIVNTNFVNDLSGNARAHYLHLSILPNQIPVSRKFTKSELLKLIS